MKIRMALCGGVAALGICAGTVAAAPPQDTSDRAAALQSALDGVHEAGVPGVFAEVRDSGRAWRGASGVADVATGRPVTPDMLQRVGSITKTFTAAAILQQVDEGRIRLDAPIADYLPDVVQGERGRKITIRMLLNHTSGIPDHIRYAFPSLQVPSPKSVDDNRFRQFSRAELIELGLSAPPAGEPDATPGVYSNTNYLILCELLVKVTGVRAEDYITRNVIRRAGLKHTYFPTGTHIKGPHARMYESLWGLIDPPRDYSVYNMSWVAGTADLVSTMNDLNRFFGRLLDGEIVSRASLREMQRTTPVIELDGSTSAYGLGLEKIDIPGCGTFWGNGGTVWGAVTMSMTRSDGTRQMSIALNLMRWNKLDGEGNPQPHPIDGALKALQEDAMCG
ncbi:hydrolase [Streptomyces albiflavescens]|uniref:Hydrolase n=1 Tax=Streptomyces albiflavescens TaxID=1623582 RepID=A0A917XU06_9ACTN|nr:serine hydrolase domain-containing protein [Streptomyces albiflavescens]GGN52129.1 hydrolase [Streptomyces albiflavescens]